MFRQNPSILTFFKVKVDAPLSSADFKFLLKVGPPSSKKIRVISLIKSPLKMMIFFYFVLKALSVRKIFKFLARLFGHVGKTA